MVLQRKKTVFKKLQEVYIQILVFNFKDILY